MKDEAAMVSPVAITDCHQQQPQPCLQPHDLLAGLVNSAELPIRHIEVATAKAEYLKPAAKIKKRRGSRRSAKMQFISQSELDLLVDHNNVEHVHIEATTDGRWTVTFQLKLRAGGVENYQLLTQRGTVRTWSDPRRMLLFLKTHYALVDGTFSVTQLPG